MQDATRYFTTNLINDEKKLIRAISSPLFHSLLELGQGMWEVISAPKVVRIKNLIQISFFCLWQSESDDARFCVQLY